MKFSQQTKENIQIFPTMLEKKIVKIFITKKYIAISILKEKNGPNHTSFSKL